MKKIIASFSFAFIALFYTPSGFGQQEPNNVKTENNKDEEGNHGEKAKNSDENDKPPVKKDTRRFTFGFEAGANISNFIYGQNNQGINISTDALFRARIGMLFDLQLHGMFYLQPGIFYAMNGSANNNDGTTWYVNTIEMPFNFQIKSGKPEATQFFVGLGPYIGYNFSGTFKNYSGDMKIGSNQKDNLKALDYGGGINAGLQLKSGLFFRLRYEQGFVNLQPQSSSIYPTIYNSSYGVQVGYLFNRKARHKPVMAPREERVWDQ